MIQSAVCRSGVFRDYPLRVLWLACLATAAGVAPAQTNYVLLHTFKGGPTDGAGPDGSLILDSAGNLYGTTVYGGPAGNANLYSGNGVVYKLSSSGKETMLYNFTGTLGDGAPYVGVIRDSAGNLYGTTYSGEVYELNSSGKETMSCILTDGYDLSAGVTRDSAGDLYGTTAYTANPPYGGLVYKVDAACNETVLYNFTGGADGGTPFAGVIRDSAGNLYGTTYGGGNASCHPPFNDIIGCGVVYKLHPNSKETVLYSFCAQPNCADGANPYAGVIRDSTGNLYGTTQYGGTSSSGVVYKLDTSRNLTVLYNFCTQPNCTDGGLPAAGVIRDASGNLYGTTYHGGAFGGGVVYKLDASGNETVLYSFCAQPNCDDGENPYAGVILDGKGNLYGTADFGGKYNKGVVFKLEPY